MSIRLAVFGVGYLAIAMGAAVVLGFGFRRHRLRRSISVADYEAQERDRAATSAAEPEETTVGV